MPSFNIKSTQVASISLMYRPVTIINNRTINKNELDNIASLDNFHLHACLFSSCIYMKTKTGLVSKPNTMLQCGSRDTEFQTATKWSHFATKIWDGGTRFYI